MRQIKSASTAASPRAGLIRVTLAGAVAPVFALAVRGAGDSLDRNAAEGGGGYGRVGGRVSGRGRRLGGYRCARFYTCDLENRPHRALLCGRRISGLRDAGFQEAR